MRISDWSSYVCSSGLRRREHGFGVAGNLHLAPDALDDAVAVDEERGAVDAHIFAAVQALFDPGAEGFADRPIRIGRERHLEVVFFGELAVLPRRSAVHTSDLQSLMRSSYAGSCLKQ